MANANNYIGKYRVIAELGTGTFGRVYKAQHQFLTSRIVAIKLMRNAPINSPQEWDQFLQEARILELLKHPYILPIIDVDIHEGSAYLVIEYAPNGSLKDRINRQQGKLLPIDEAITILSQVGQALQYAHRQNIIHRDLKPENILFNSRGEAVLADFGIATLLASARTRQVGLGGTPAYMAPEQFEGLISTKSDQYALGCIAYELLTGHKPFNVPHPSLEAMWFQHAKISPVAPRQINPRLPEHVESAILKAMAKQRTDRYADISAFITALVKPTTSQAVLLSAKPKVLRLDVAQLTDTGRKRGSNEDNMAFVIPKDPVVMANKGALFIVADGGSVGGPAGEVASEIAVDTVANMYYQDDSDDVVVSLVRAIKRANTSIHQRAAQNMLRTGMGTTCVAAVLRGNMAYIANVGDSRAYLLHGSQVEQVSHDHSWVAEQVRAGLLTEDQARTHAQRNVITRCLGTQAEVDVDIFHEELSEGDSLVLCTDGLSGLVSDEELKHIVEQFVPQESVYHLVELANENGGPDNITTIVVKVQEVGEEPPGVRYPVGVGGREQGEEAVTLEMHADAPVGAANNGEDRISSAPLRLSSGPLITSPDSITAPQPVLVKPKPGRSPLFYPAIALIALLVITLAGGGVFYFLHANENKTVNQILDTTQQQINAANPANPTTALSALSTAQKMLRDLQNNHQLDAAQMHRMTSLQNQLVNQVNAAISTYNNNAKISVLTCPANPIDNASLRTFPQSIAYAQNAQGGPFLYALAQDKSIYKINNQSNSNGMVVALSSGTPSPSYLSLASNGSFLFVVEAQGKSYFLKVFHPDAQGKLGAPVASTPFDPAVMDGGYVPGFSSAWGSNVYVVLSSMSNQGTARILSYVLDAKGNLSTPKRTDVTISAPIVSIAAFPDQLFLLLSTGNVQSSPLVNASQPSKLTTTVLVQPPIAQPLTMSGFTTGDVVPTVTPNISQGSAPLSVQSASPANSAMLIAGQVNRKPHLYIGDPLNHRVLDLAAASGVLASPTPSPTGTNAVPNSVTLQLEQQYVSSTSFNQLKGLAADSLATKLTVLSQNTSPIASLVSISNGTPPSCAS